MTEIQDFIKTNKYWLLFSLIFLFFIFTHISGIHAPYHQDEYKWIFYSHPELTVPGTVPHPPLTEFIYTRIGPIVGDSNFRLIPFFFGVFNFFLLFYLAKIIFNKKTALWVIFLFSISFYSLLASLMVDVDGAIMPFFFLLLSIGYFRWKETLKETEKEKKKWKWVILMIIGAIGGFLIKVSAVLPIMAIFLDFLIEKEVFSDKKKIIKYIFYALGGVFVLVIVLVLAKFLFPFFNLEYALKYWEHFIVFQNRGWFQTLIQFFKSILYTSPLLVIIPTLFIDKEIFRKTRVFYFFIFAGIFLYIFAFDFSTGALDRYFQFMVIPLSIIVGSILSKIFGEESQKIKIKYIIPILVLTVLLFCVQFLPHFVPALHPKMEWLSRMLSLKWNFLYPFSGGSGPLGFYVSFLFIGLSWILSTFVATVALYKFNFRKIAIFSILLMGLFYNITFTGEYLFGAINGSAPKVLKGAVEFIKNNPDIKFVTVYNDNGGYDIQMTNKYRKRLYTDPMFGVEVKIETLNKYKEHYLEINVPRIDPNSFYRRYFDSCKTIYQDTDKNISATVYDCQNAPLLTP